jgi:hypothetical protein
MALLETQKYEAALGVRELNGEFQHREVRVAITHIHDAVCIGVEERRCLSRKMSGELQRLVKPRNDVPDQQG